MIITLSNLNGTSKKHWVFKILNVGEKTEHFDWNTSF